MSNLQVIHNEDIYDPRVGYGSSHEDGQHVVNLPMDAQYLQVINQP